MYQDRCYDRDVEINNNYFAEDMNNYNDFDFNNMNQNSNVNMNYNDSCGMNPVVEPMQEKCVHRTIMHEVPHVC